MIDWQVTIDILDGNVNSIARELSMLTPSGRVKREPEELTDEYFDEVRVRARSFLILCSSELEEFVEARCLEYLLYWAQDDAVAMQHNCIHALTIHFRRNINNLLEKQGVFVDFYASTEQVRRITSPKKKG